MNIEHYGLSGHFQIHRDHRRGVAALIQGTPILSAVAVLIGDALTVSGEGLAMTHDEWSDVHSTLLACAARARRGFVDVYSPGNFDTRFPARG